MSAAEDASIGGMTVNERLAHFGLVAEFDAAARSRDRALMIAVLRKARFSEDQAEYTSAQVLKAPQRYGY